MKKQQEDEQWLGEEGEKRNRVLVQNAQWKCKEKKMNGEWCKKRSLKNDEFVVELWAVDTGSLCGEGKVTKLQADCRWTYKNEGFKIL